MKGTTVPHGTASRYRNNGCRCEACTAANAAVLREWRAVNGAVGLRRGDPRHGTLSGYVHYGCRCPLCTAARAAYDYARRGRGVERNGGDAMKGTTSRGLTHGRPSTYNAGCRCRPCTAAHSERHRVWAERVAGTLAPDDPRHGTANGYRNYGCRCPECTAVHSAECTRRRESTRASRTSAR